MLTNTSPTDYRINKQMQMMKFNGKRWELFGPIIEDAGPVKQLGSIGGSPPASHCPRRRRSRFETVSSGPRPATAARRQLWILFVQSEPMPLLWALLVSNMKSPPCRPALLAMQYAFRQYRRSDGVRLGSIKLRARFIGSINNP